MIADNIIQSVIITLKSSGTNIRCNEVISHLSSLGFEVRNGKSPGHKIYTHDGLVSFTSSSFSCGHGRNPEVTRPYITNIIRTIREHESELNDWLKTDKREVSHD